MRMRSYSGLDQIIGRFDKFLRVFPKNLHSSLSTSVEQKHSAALMRINHSGEVCAQALYLGQALVARDQKLAEQLHQSAKEEQVHLSWCANRIQELGGRRSFLNPIWAVGSFGIGVMAGLWGDKISLGFLAETEEQVTQHLERHLREISVHDKKSQIILIKMQEDEKRHAINALALGGIPLPKPIRHIMYFCSKIMTITARYI